MTLSSKEELPNTPGGVIARLIRTIIVDNSNLSTMLNGLSLYVHTIKDSMGKKIRSRARKKLKEEEIYNKMKLSEPKSSAFIEKIEGETPTIKTLSIMLYGAMRASEVTIETVLFKDGDITGDFKGVMGMGELENEPPNKIPPGVVLGDGLRHFYKDISNIKLPAKAKKEDITFKTYIEFLAKLDIDRINVIIEYTLPRKNKERAVETVWVR